MYVTYPLLYEKLTGYNPLLGRQIVNAIQKPVGAATSTQYNQ